ncbi:hypothetical protein [Bacillus sp. T33-2]|uniref:hypothetical protein n=1 Tax=Bacillus sp. T33-2 TaxID=2054168 RepID=UPI000C760CD8|nr:hypothetical protein [Bacillus sp. T33-2]PLR99250.1 hypothetical protein CVD19_02750 [Bacillus sp. T33-2]
MIDKKLLEEMQEYIDSHLNIMELQGLKACEFIDYNIDENRQHSELEDFIKNNRKPTLAQVLFSFIDNKGATDSEIYKRAGIDRKHFSKIRSNPNYRPGKNTIIALALALELDKEDTEDLLSLAGYSLSDSDTSDLIIQFCLEKKIYDIHFVNQALDSFSLKPLTGAL